MRVYRIDGPTRPKWYEDITQMDMTQEYPQRAKRIDDTQEIPAIGQVEREPDHSTQMLSWVLVLVVMLVYGGLCVWLGTKIR